MDACCGGSFGLSLRFRRGDHRIYRIDRSKYCENDGGEFALSFDSDFCKGKVVDTKFVNSGNDAFDASGSVVSLINVEVDGCGDKGVSSGEASNLSATDLVVRDANIGFAAKDLSKLLVNGVSLENCTYSVAAYQKKPEYGPGYVRVEKLETDVDPVEKSIVEVDCTVLINGKQLDHNAKGVKAELYK